MGDACNDKLDEDFNGDGVGDDDEGYDRWTTKSVQLPSSLLSTFSWP